MRIRTRLARIASLVLPLVATGCFFDDGGSSSGSGGSAGPSIELIPGDTLQKTLGSGTNPGPDTLYIAFHADSGSTYRLSVADPESKLKLAVTGRDTALQYTSSAVDFNRRNTLIDFPCVLTGTYLLRVTGPAGSLVKVAVDPRKGLPSSFVGPDAFEPDSTLRTASNLPADGQWHWRTGTSGVESDVDWFRVKTLPGRTYTVEFKDSVVLYGTTRSLWGGDSGMIGPPTTGSLEYASFDTSGFWVRTDCTPGGVRYRLRATESIGYPSGSTLPDAFESDDSLHPASGRTDSTVLSRTLHGRSSSQDVDWTKIDLEAGRTWTLALWDTSGFANSRLSGLPAGFEITANVSSKGKARVSTWIVPAASRLSLLLRTEGTVAGGYAVQAWVSGPLPDSMRTPDAWEIDSKAAPMFLESDSQEVSRNFHGIGASSDTDWIAMDLDSGRTYFLRLRDSGEGISPVFSGLPPGISVELLDLESLEESGNQSIWSFPAIAKGKVVLRLAKARAAGYSATAWSHSALPDSLRPERGEPDDVPGLAFELPPESASVVKRVIGDDTDWISVRKPMDSAAVLRIRNLGTNVMNWWPDPRESPRNIYPGQSDSATLFHLRSGRILAQIWNADSGDPRTQYSLASACKPLPPDALEPNDSPAKAALLKAGAPPTKGWASIDDTDWIAIDIPAGHAARIAWLSQDGIDMVATGPGSAPVSFLGADQNGDTLVQHLATPGRNLLRLVGSNSSVMTYEIGFDTVNLDPEEPNGTPSQAKAILLDSLAHSTILTTNDTDWFSFPVHAGWLYAVSRDRSSAEAAVFFQGQRIPLRKQFTDSAFEAPGEGTAFLALSRKGPASFPPEKTAFGFKICPGDSLSATTDSLHPKIIQSNSGPHRLELAPQTDIWLGVPVKSGARYSLEDFTSRTSYLGLVAYSGADTALWAKFISSSGSWTAPADGMLKLHIRSTNPFWESTPDTMSFSLREEPPNPGAPNFDSAHALELPTDSSFQSRTFFSADTEYFKIHVEAGRQYTLWIEADETLRLEAMGASDSPRKTLLASGGQLVAWSLGTASSDGYWTFKMEDFIAPLVRYRIGVSSR